MREQIRQAIVSTLVVENKQSVHRAVDKIMELIGDDLITAKRSLVNLTDEQRMEVFSDYCRYCGCDDPTCRSWYRDWWNEEQDEAYEKEQK